VDYLVNFFDEHEHLRRAELLTCPDDHVAITKASILDHQHAIELWHGDRFVWRFEARLCLAKAS
jgi:hypothetical protein